MSNCSDGSDAQRRRTANRSKEAYITMRTTTMNASGSRQTARSAVAWAALAGALAMALLTLALSATPAQGTERNAATPLSGGKTLLTLDNGTAAALSDAGVRVKATGPAIGPAGSNVFAFPIVGGKVNKEQLSGRIVHSGGLAFTAGGERLAMRRFVIDLGRGVLTAEVAGAGVRVPLLRLGAPTGGVQVAPGVLVLKGVNARLSAPAAGALNQTFDTDLFEAGLPIGKATVIARTGV
jgi:hypothetical protein